MQLFYGHFGTVRQQLALRGSGGVSWEATVAASLEVLIAASAQATIEASPARLKSCMEMEGGHFEKGQEKLTSQLQGWQLVDSYLPCRSAARLHPKFGMHAAFDW
jgi:hypothetical protein